MADRKDREDRLAAALRENLKRRKSQARERNGEAGRHGAESGGAPAVDGVDKPGGDGNE